MHAPESDAHRALRVPNEVSLANRRTPEAASAAQRPVSRLVVSWCLLSPWLPASLAAVQGTGTRSALASGRHSTPPTYHQRQEGVLRENRCLRSCLGTQRSGDGTPCAPTRPESPPFGEVLRPTRDAALASGSRGSWVDQSPPRTATERSRRHGREGLSEEGTAPLVTDTSIQAVRSQPTRTQVLVDGGLSERGRSWSRSSRIRSVFSRMVVTLWNSHLGGELSGIRSNRSCQSMVDIFWPMRWTKTPSKMSRATTSSFPFISGS